MDPSLMELEEGEYIEEEELEKRLALENENRHRNAHLPPPPNKTKIASKNHNTEQKRSEEDDYETVSMELDSDNETTKNKRKAPHHLEDDTEFLRKQLLFQVRKKKAKQMLQPKENVTAPEEESVSSNHQNQQIEKVATTIYLSQMKDNLSNLNEQLTEAQLKQSAILRKRRKLQDSLAECETELVQSHAEISSIIEAIGALWNNAFDVGLGTALTETKNELKDSATNSKQKEAVSKENDSHPNTNFESEPLTRQSLIPSPPIPPELPIISKKSEELNKEDQRRTPSVHTRSDEKQQARRHGTPNSSSSSSTFSKSDSNIRRDRERRSSKQHSDHEQRMPGSGSSKHGSNREERMPGSGSSKHGSDREERRAPSTSSKHGSDRVGRRSRSLNSASDANHQLNKKVELKENSSKATRNLQMVPKTTEEVSNNLKSKSSRRLLAHHAVSNRLDPFIPLCPFELHGRCADAKCPWQHENEYMMSDQDIVAELIELWPRLCPDGLTPDEYAAQLLATDSLDTVVGFLLSTMPEEAFGINLHAMKGIPRLADKPIPPEERVEFIPFFPQKRNQYHPQQTTGAASPIY